MNRFFFFCCGVGVGLLVSFFTNDGHCQVTETSGAAPLITSSISNRETRVERIVKDEKRHQTLKEMMAHTNDVVIDELFGVKIGSTLDEIVVQHDSTPTVTTYGIVATYDPLTTPYAEGDPIYSYVFKPPKCFRGFTSYMFLSIRQQS